MSAAIDSKVIARWRTARRMVLGTIILAGTLATAATVASRVAGDMPEGMTRVAPLSNNYTYSGIGVALGERNGQVYVRHVFRHGPSDGLLHRGAALVSVDGEKLTTRDEWMKHLRGRAGTEVEIEVAYPCSGHETVSLTRDVVQVRRDRRHHPRHPRHRHPGHRRPHFDHEK